MLQNLRVENFRGFKRFELNPLGRINLFVGANNSGKTSLLEAIYLLLSPNPMIGLDTICMGRNEYEYSSDDTSSRTIRRLKQLTIIHLMYNHQFLPGSCLEISASSSHQNNKNLTISVEIEQDSQGELDLYEVDFASEMLILKIENKEHFQEPLKIPLSSEGFLVLDDIRRSRELRQRAQSFPVQWVPILGTAMEEILESFNKISLTPEEDRVIAALQILEPKLQRIAPQSSTRFYSSSSFIRGGFKVKIEGQDQPVPIGTMGEGMWRMLGLVLAIVNAKDGVLLIDEIDSGLHFTAMTPMWRMIAQTAQDLNVQVFATTHSQDCFQSLAQLIDGGGVDDGEVTCHRIEPGKSQSVPLTGRQIVIAADQEIEVR